MSHLPKSFLKASFSNDFIHLSPLDLLSGSTSSFAHPSLITSVFQNLYAILYSSPPPLASSLLLNCMFPGVVGWIVSTLQNSVHLKPQNVNWFAKRVFADIICLGSWDEILLALKEGPKSNDRCLYKRKEREITVTARHRAKMTWEDWGRDQPEAKESQAPPEAEVLKGKEDSTFPWTCVVKMLTPSFQTSGLQHCERRNFYCLKPPRLW